MVIRVEQESIHPLKQFMLQYLPEEIALKEMPEEYEITIGHSLPDWLQYKFKWTDI